MDHTYSNTLSYLLVFKKDYFYIAHEKRAMFNDYYFLCVKYWAYSFIYGGSFAWGKKNDIKLTHIRNVYRFFRFYIVKLESKYN